MEKLYIGLIVLLALSACDKNKQLSDAYGNFEAKEIIVSSEANGKLLSFSVDKGQEVMKSEIIGMVDTMQLYLNKKKLYAQLDLIKSKKKSVKAQVEVQEKQKDNLLKEKNRLENLLNDGAATSKQMDDINGKFELLEKQIEATQVQYKLIRNEKAALLVQLEQIDDQLKRCGIANPINGTVLEKYVEESELVSIGRNLYKVADLRHMDLRVYVSGSQLSQIKIGQQVRVYIDKNDKENSEMEGKISWISSSAEFTPKIIQTKEERVKLVYAVLVSVKNDGSIKIGMPGEVVFSGSQ